MKKAHRDLLRFRFRPQFGTGTGLERALLGLFFFEESFTSGRHPARESFAGFDGLPAE
jgi:hypothetical protein